MNIPAKAISYTNQNLKFRLLEDITSFIVESLSSYRAESIQKLRISLEKFSENGVFIWKDIKTYKDAVKKFEELGLLTIEDKEKLIQKNGGEYPNVSITFSGRKHGMASFEEAISDIYGVYAVVLSTALKSPKSGNLIDINYIDLILQSVKNFQIYIENLKINGFSVSGRPQKMSYPYDIKDFVEVEKIVQMIPGMENFGLKYIPKEIGIEFVDKIKKDKVIAATVQKTADIITLDNPDRMNLFDGMNNAQTDLILSYLNLSNQILQSYGSKTFSKYKGDDKKFLESSIVKYKNFMEEILIDESNSVNIGIITLMANFIDFFEAKLSQVSSDDFDDSSKNLFFTECLKEFNTTLLRGILLHSTTYKKFIDTKGMFFSQNIKNLIGEKFIKLFPSLD